MNEKMGVVNGTHPDLMAIYLQVGRAYLKLGAASASPVLINDAQLPTAPQLNPGLVQKAVDVLTKAVGVGDANSFVYKQSMGDSLFYLGMALAESGQVENALDNIERSLKVYRQLHGKWSVPVAKAFRQIAFLFIRRRNASGALPYLTLVIRAEARLHGPNSLQVADLHKTRGDIFILADRIDDAIHSFREAAAIYETQLGGDCAQVAECRQRIARVDHKPSS